ncbi:MAG: hypothetical protein ABII06_18015, partial [Pseudomonadota bacterium]
RRLIIWSIIGTGVSSIAVQLVTVREFMTQFHGNELTISLALFCWLFVTGIGSLLAKPLVRSSLTSYSLLCILIAVWPLLQTVLIRSLRETFFTHGASPGFYPIFFFILAATTPYCLMLGFILPYALKVLNNLGSAFSSGDLYITDSIGDISGGVLFSFLLVYWLSPFKNLAVSSGLLLFTALWLLAWTRRSVLLAGALLSAVLFYGFSLSSRFEVSTLAGQYGAVSDYRESPYGRIVITKEGRQHTFWESGLPLYSDGNLINSEEKVHYPLSQLDEVRNVLLISGGLGETITEILKHRPGHIDYVELDPYLTDAAGSVGLLKPSPRLSVLNVDGRRYIETTKKRYDAVIIDLPEPDTFQINRFFTGEFFSHVKKVLAKGGVFSFSLNYSHNYISELTKKKLSVMFHTARSQFRHVMILPGGDAYFLCRDEGLTPDVPARLKSKSVQTSYIEGFYYGNVTDERIGKLREALEDESSINRDFEPVIMNIVFQAWFGLHGTSPKIFFLVFLALTGLYLISIRKEEYALFSTGLATMGVEMLIIFTFQVTYGYVYLKIGAIITAFLLGLLPGSLLGNYLKGGKWGNLILSEAALTFLLIVFFLWVGFFKGSLPPVFFLAYGFGFSFFCGFQFPSVTHTLGEGREPAPGCLAADLSGAAVGTLITGVLLIPLWGMEAASFFLIVVKISSNMLILFGKRTS